MLIFAIDDEPRALRVLHNAISEAQSDAEILDFDFAAKAVQAVEQQGKRPDIVFTDIRMPGMDGLALAAKIRELSPGSRIVFVTAFGDYSLDAWRMHAGGYILKPVQAEQIREELDCIRPESDDEAGKLKIRCFGNFEVFWNGEPLKFDRRQTKELLAYLVDREGATCSAEEIVSTLWEDDADMSAAKNRLRQLVNDLKRTLAGIGMSEVLIRHSGQMAVRREKLNCDYYRMLDGDVNAVNSFRGEYMKQYTWAELTAGRLYFRGNSSHE